jgi:hypothetical protein
LNLAKNNFCAVGAPVLVTFASFKNLQLKLDHSQPAALHWDRDHLPADRSIFQSIYKTSSGDTIGEGSVVRLAAWLMKRRPGSNESCNCDGGTAEANADIHLVWISSSDRENTPECSSVTAEVSPHERPSSWVSHIILLANDHPFRITGQLMYDAAHRPCAGTPPKAAASAPARVSSWEIHPVYGIDVCKDKSLRSCTADDDSAWTDLDTWAKESEGGTE